jgi:O-antigen/teichoic acid export membrane protein
MNSIRRQSILSTLLIYGGFAVGLFNTYLFTKQGLFTDEEFGLYNVFIAIALLMAAVANLGAPYFIYKFFPYYQARLQPQKNDQLTLALLIALMGFGVLLATGYWLEPLVIQKYSGNAPSLVSYFKWIYPLGAGLLLFNVLEAWSWQHGFSVTSNFLKEAVWRFFILILIAGFAFGWISSFDLFIKLFALSYPFIAITLMGWLAIRQKLTIGPLNSPITQRLKKPILGYTSFTYAGTLIFTLAQVFDSILIGSVLENAMAQLAIYSLAQNMASILQAPQRGIIAASIAPLSKAWKEKDRATLAKIYQRSSINQLLFAGALFGLIFLNFNDTILTLQLKPSYLAGLTVFCLLGFTRLIDMGTGVNTQLIITSPSWKFEFKSGMILLVIMLPLSYYLTKKYGITGTALAQLISILLYNSIRIAFLWKKYRLQPFTINSLGAIAVAAVSIGLIYFLFNEANGWTFILWRSFLFILIFAACTWFLKLSPDLKPVLNTLKQRIQRK